MKTDRLITAVILTVTGLIVIPLAFGKTEFEQFLQSCGNLKTIAGTGRGDKGTNWWKPEFEGAPGAEVELSNPHITMADEAGNYYIADKESHRIIKVDNGGRATTFAGTGQGGFNGENGKATDIQLYFPNGIHVFPDGTVYILDNFNDRVRKVTQAGRLTTVFEDPDGFHHRRTLWVSNDAATIYYGSSPDSTCELRRWTADDKKITALAGGFLDLAYMDVAENGDIYITEQGRHLVHRLSPDGKEQSIVAGNGTTDEPIDNKPATEIGLNEVRGIALLPKGGFLVCTHKGGDIVHVDSDGIANVLIRGSGEGNIHTGDGEPITVSGDKISEPRSVTLAPNGDVIITCNDSGFVRIIPRSK
ncbi:MAG: hypothetical protein O3C21_15540 [Verrucomicrobia bacterium]|nr:hypothetical protein [Verrucomicrobiota bacterium]